MQPNNRAAELGKRILEARLAKNWSQRELATAAGVSPGYVSHLEKGAVQRPSKEALDAIASALGFSSADGMQSGTARATRSRESAANNSLEDVVAIPIVGVASAGVTYAGEVHLTREEIAGRPLKGMKITGDCLAPDVEPGDTVIIDVAAVPQPGEIVVVKDEENGDIMAKFFARSSEGVAELHRNDGPPVPLAGPLTLLGVVFQINRRPGRRRPK